ncbi:MAG: DUF2169 domain-containing protein [Nannocystis sp.]|nr:DUF2169 domain-containing protein [Nannocystis sp.]
MNWSPHISCLALDADGRPLVSVLTKRTYALRADGRAVPAEAQLPLDTTADPPTGGYDPSWRAELDVAPFKVATDVVVFGRAYAPGGSCVQMQVEVELPHLGRASRLLVTGDRRCSWRSGGAPAISPPEPFETLPLGYDRAYGGVDPTVGHLGPPRGAEEALRQLMSVPGAYPRNPAGRGYVVHNRPELVDGLLLPNIERPDSLLRPDRVVVGDPRGWHRQPLPGGFGWLDVGWFPRCAFAGAFPAATPPSGVAEAALGHLPADYIRRLAGAEEGYRLDPRLFNGASLGLTTPHLRGDEVIVTRGLCREGELAARLPGDRPDVRVRAGGRSLPVDLVPHTVALLVEERLVSLVWRASAALPTGWRPGRPSLDDLEIAVVPS